MFFILQIEWVIGNDDILMSRNVCLVVDKSPNLDRPAIEGK